MLRLLFCTAAILPIALIPWLTDSADAVGATPAEAVAAVDDGYVATVVNPSLAALESCETEALPVFFNDEDVTRHSAEFVQDGLEAASGCDDVDVVIIPVVPADAARHELAESAERTSELVELVEAQGLDVRVADETRDASGSLYLNGRAAVLRIEPTVGPH